MMRDHSKNTINKRTYKSPRRSRDPRCTDPLYDITFFETGKRKKCYSCPDLLFISDVDYLLHLEESHEGQRMHCCICSDCGKTFGSASELQQHTVSKCGTQARFTCEVCGKKLMSAGSLYTHMLLHGESNYTCNFCGKQFHNVHHLKAHERTHTKVPLYTCEVCGKGFAHRQSIITHSSLHTGIKPYSCEHCGKGFSCISNLLKHRKTHATTCGALPLTSHRIKNAETKMRIRMNTPATAKQKNYSRFKMNELVEKRTVHAVRFLTKKKELFDNILSDNIQLNAEQILEKGKVQCIKEKVVGVKNNLKRKFNAKYKNKNCSTIIDISNQVIDNKPSINVEATTKSNKCIINANLKQEINPDVEFDSDDSIPLCKFIYSSNNGPSKEVSSTNVLKLEDGFGTNTIDHINIKNEDIICNLCESSYKKQADYDIHKENHSTDKFDIKYVEGFQENDFDNDDALQCINTDDEECNNNGELEEAALNFPTSTNLAEHKIIIKIKRERNTCMTKAQKLKLDLKENRNKDLVNTKPRNVYKCSTENKTKEPTKQLILQEGNNVPIEIKADIEDLTIQSFHYVLPKEEEVDLNVNIDKLSVVKKGLKKLYECTICGTYFKGHQWLRKHQQGKGFKYKGQECAGSRTTKRKNEIDLNFIILPNEIADEVLEDDAASLDNVPISTRINNKERLIKGRQQFMCKICGTVLKYQKSMVKHQMGKSFINKAGGECAGPSLGRPQIINNSHEEIDEKQNYPYYKDIVEAKKEGRKVQCEICKRTFAGMYLLKKHQKNKFNKDHFGLDCATVGGQKVRKCDYCPLYLEKGIPMKAHKRSVHANILTCDICDKVFSKPDVLDYHRKAKHKLVPREELPRRDYIYVCDKCGAQYKHKSSLKEHERTGCGCGPLFQCDRCDARLHNIYTLKTHMAKHVEEKKHLCTFCGMKFMMKVQLKNHLYRHTGEKPFKCTVCPKAFAHSTSLDTHISTHTGIKRYICLACGKRFSCYGNLDKHKASKSCKEWYNLNGEKKKLRILDEKPSTCNI